LDKTQGANNKIKVFIPARDVSLSLTRVGDVSLLNQLPATILAVETDTPHTRLFTLDCEGQKILSRITTYSATQLKLEIGQKVFALIKTVSLATPDTESAHV
jgi:molybdate transport system ATP-binding protein